MHQRYWFAATLACALLFAGCVEEESRQDEAGSDARHFTIDVPEGATEVHVDVSGTAREGEPDVTVLIEDEAGNNLATDTWSLTDNTERRVSVDAAGHARLVVTVRVVDGDAELDVRVSATVPSQPAPVVILEERVVIVQVVQPAAPASPTPASPPPVQTADPTPEPEPTPTPPPTNDTNTTNTTNDTNATA